MEAIRSSETSVLIRATRRHLPEDDNHHSHRRGNLKSYNLPLLTPFCFTMNHKYKDMFHEVENITAKYQNFSCAKARNPLCKSKLTLYYKTKTRELSNYYKKNKIYFLPFKREDQLQNNCRVRISKGPIRLQSGSWWSHNY
jgi:hypothetical protein